MPAAGAGARPTCPTDAVTIRRATSGAGLRAAAALRAAAFAANLPAVSAFAREAYVRTRYADAWAALEERVARKDASWRGVEIDVWLATIPDDDVDGRDGERGANAAPSLAALVRAAGGDASASLVAGAGADPPPAARALAVGTLDVNTGARLPCEALAAPAPAGGGALAYLSNVAVAAPARRRGVAAALVAHALATSGAARVAVHVEVGNEGAAALYQKLMGPAKAVESVAVARAAGRPRRALHWVDL